MIDIVAKAAELANRAHAGQKRKYNGRPYVEHPMRVAGRIATHWISGRSKAFSAEQLIAIAWLHDVIEDASENMIDEMFETFDPKVLEGVEALTGTPAAPGSGLSRVMRKTQDAIRLGKAAPEIKIIKMLDRVDNLTDLDRSNPFSKLYARESLYLAEKIGNADLELKAELVKLAEGLLS